MNQAIIQQFAQLRNSSHVNCAVSHAHAQNVCACRTMNAPRPRATMAACGCNKSGGRHITPAPKSDRQRGLGGVAKSTGERALQHFHSSYLPPFWFLLFLYLREPATFTGGGDSYPPFQNKRTAAHCSDKKETKNEAVFELRSLTCLFFYLGFILAMPAQ